MRVLLLAPWMVLALAAVPGGAECQDAAKPGNPPPAKAEPLSRTPFPAYVSAIAFSPDGKSLALTLDGQVNPRAAV